MIKLTQTNRYKKEVKLILKRGYKVHKIFDVVNLLRENVNKGIEHHLLLPENHYLHKLSGKYTNYWECHIEPDWLLIYYLDDEVLRLERTGTHSDLF